MRKVSLFDYLNRRAAAVVDPVVLQVINLANRSRLGRELVFLFVIIPILEIIAYHKIVSVFFSALGRKFYEPTYTLNDIDKLFDINDHCVAVQDKYRTERLLEIQSIIQYYERKSAGFFTRSSSDSEDILRVMRDLLQGKKTNPGTLPVYLRPVAGLDCFEHQLQIINNYLANDKNLGKKLHNLLASFVKDGLANVAEKLDQAGQYTLEQVRLRLLHETPVVQDNDSNVLSIIVDYTGISNS